MLRSKMFSVILQLAASGRDHLVDAYRLIFLYHILRYNSCRYRIWATFLDHIACSGASFSSVTDLAHIVSSPAVSPFLHTAILEMRAMQHAFLRKESSKIYCGLGYRYGDLSLGDNFVSLDEIGRI